jgi:hypothetical protein
VHNPTSLAKGDSKWLLLADVCHDFWSCQ